MCVIIVENLANIVTLTYKITAHIGHWCLRLTERDWWPDRPGTPMCRGHGVTNLATRTGPDTGPWCLHLVTVLV